MSDNTPYATQRRIIVVCNGLDPGHIRHDRMPTLNQWAGEGMSGDVQAVMPSVGTLNNASICCGAFPAQHGFTGEPTFPAANEDGTRSAEGVGMPTLFERAGAYGVRSALLTSKRTMLRRLGSGAEIRLAADSPEPEWQERLGTPPAEDSPAMAAWLLRAAQTVLRERPDIGCIYVHTGEGTMQAATKRPGGPEELLRTVDDHLADLASVAPDAARLITSDHRLSAKHRCWDLVQVAISQRLPIRQAVTAGDDAAHKGDSTYAGAAWISVDSDSEREAVRHGLLALSGVADVLTREAAVQAFALPDEGAGDLMVLGDRETVFGHLDAPCKALRTPTFGAGSQHERHVPLVIHNALDAPAAGFFRYNIDLARWLYRQTALTSRPRLQVAG